MKSLVLIFLLTAGASVVAATNVNISFTQQHLSSAPKHLATRNHHVQLTSFGAGEQLRTDDQNVRFAKIQLDDKKDDSDLKQQGSTVNYRSGNIQNVERSEFVNHGDQQIHSQLRKYSPQDKQNMEFERYIQSYHSGPTVETVYETAKPEMKHTLHSSSVSNDRRQSNVNKFERQIALPSTMESGVTASDQKDIHTVGNSPLPSIVPSSSSSTSSSSSNSIPNVSSSSGNSFQVNSNQKPASVGQDGFSYNKPNYNDPTFNSNQKPVSVGQDGFSYNKPNYNDPTFNSNQKPVSVGQDGFSYNKPNYNDPTFKYKEGHSDSHFYNQFPPSVEEPQGGYGGYYGQGFSNHQQSTHAYRPVDQRPVVTKTIQIAQPAIKAKKYEVRHPAIQKEFYDIEERVVIKPAGTVVVELERPSAKILKEETTLPLGHPHPAVAAAYMSNKSTPTFSNIIYSNTGSSQTSNHPNNQYVPQNSYSNKNAPDHRSTSQTYNHISKEVAVDSNPINQYSGTNHYAAVVSSNSQKSQNREIVVVTDGQGNQRQVSADQFSYSRDETDKVPLRTLHKQRNSLAYENNGRISSQTNISPQRSESREELASETEYINNSGNNNFHKESKPARLQESYPKVPEEQPQTQPIIKHEHKIVLSPSQHNIYLNSNQEVPKMKFIGEPAHVREISPYLQNHRGPVVVYAMSKQNSETPYNQRSEYQSKSRASSQVVQFRDSPNIAHLKMSDNRVQYSAPYAQMRHNPESEPHVFEQLNQKQKNFVVQKKSEKLILGDNVSMDEKKFSEENVMEKQEPQAHIQIKIPKQSSHNPDNAIIVSSTIRPMLMNDDHNSKLEISVTNNGTPQENQQDYNESSKSSNEQKNSDNDNYSMNNSEDEADSEHLSHIKMEADCGKLKTLAQSENYKISSDFNNKQPQQKFMRIVENTADVSTSSANEASSSIEASANQLKNVDINVKSSVGNVSPAGSRVLSATPAPKEATPSESFHKRRIVVNHPFQTVREVVEHEPYTKYHEVQVNEPATPALYHSANYFRSY